MKSQRKSAYAMTIIVIGLASGLVISRLSAAPGTSKLQQQNDGDSQRLTFLGNCISADEEGIATIDGILDPSQPPAVANNGDGSRPIPWPQTYVRCANLFFSNSSLAQAYTFAADREEVGQARSAVGALGKRTEVLIGRRRELEAEQGLIWATIAFDAIGNRFGIHGGNSATVAPDPVAPSVTPSHATADSIRVAHDSAHRAALLFDSTLVQSSQTTSSQLDADQLTAYLNLRDAMANAGNLFAKSANDFIGSNSNDPAGKATFGDLEQKAARLGQLAADIHSSYQKSLSWEWAGQHQKEKALSRAIFQESLFTFTAAAIQFDQSISSLERSPGWTAADLLSPATAPSIAPAGWVALFRSNDPSHWGHEFKSRDGKEFSHAFDSSTPTYLIRYIRMTRVDTGAAVIVPFNLQSNQIATSMNLPGGLIWNGLDDLDRKQSASGTSAFNYHMGIGYDRWQHASHDNATVAGPITFASAQSPDQTDHYGYSGWGFARPNFVWPQPQAFCWAGRIIDSTAFEIAVKAGDLTPDETALLLPNSLPPQDQDLDGPFPQIVIGTAVKLLQLVKVDDDTVAGHWTLAQSGLQSDATSPAKLRLPFIPFGEYDFRVSLTRITGDGPVCLLLSFGGRQFAILVGDEHNTVVRFATDDAHPPVSFRSVTRRQAVLVNGRPYELVIRVRAHLIICYIDDVEVCELNTDSLAPADAFWSINDSSLGIASDSPTTFSEIDVIPVSGQPIAGTGFSRPHNNTPPAITSAGMTRSGGTDGSTVVVNPAGEVADTDPTDTSADNGNAPAVGPSTDDNGNVVVRRRRRRRAVIPVLPAPDTGNPAVPTTQPTVNRPRRTPVTGNGAGGAAVGKPGGNVLPKAPPPQVRPARKSPAGAGEAQNAGQNVPAPTQ